MEKEKAISESTVNNQRIGITLKLEAMKKNFVSSRSKKSFTDVLYSTLSQSSHFDVFHH